MYEQSLETIELELAILIRRSTSVSSNKKLGNLDRSAYLLMRRIANRGAAGVKVLAGEFQLDISTISRQAAALEQKGYLYRIPDPLDGRAYSLQITEIGNRVYKEHKQARLERLEELINDWSEEEREIFGQLLKKFNQSFY
ncbi:DNA-binding MarR family transcriptional regulator [Bacillus sp. SORGH_AS 510]|uniref:MarR family winged helix-turn-helix transcriptional regulator n=1 Tax=Bacillus sp. SORGH_AS_0510 TaxID=3041771 RepID=UPI0027828BBB|nr:MarR family transcriptional regulator [Bacillus sp. SORGH_AS_0510]MDQ1146498.1 DNA-binding MarR family transcriptional regulator [Bacillus sp. SORGH_AS_0510]